MHLIPGGFFGGLPQHHGAGGIMGAGGGTTGTAVLLNMELHIK
jgi:hypothetical protein